jgi:predicted TPR repeat methyltransferase
MRSRVEAERFERLYEESPDPWHYDTSPYERGKYAATLAALDGRRFARALEVGCSIGVFTEQLAPRCESLVAFDYSTRAVALARERVAGLENVTVVLGSFPEHASSGPWELVVCSEVLYYLDRRTLDLAIDWLRARLDEGATVLAVDWRGPARTEPLGGDEVHELLTERLARRHALSGRHPRFRIDRFDGDAG